MKGTDKFLLAIVAAVLLLVAGAVVMVLRRPVPTYEQDSTAEDVAYNYLLALQQQDYAQAYGYLSPSLKGYPRTADRFIQDVLSNKYALPSENDPTTLEVVSGRALASSEDIYEVTVRETFYSRGLLFTSNQYSTNFDMELQRESGEWKIRSSDQYFVYCWKQLSGCK